MSVLRLDNVVLRPLEQDDLLMVYKLNMDYGICAGAGFWADLPTVTAFLGWMQEYMDKINKDKVHLAIELHTDRVAGVISAFEISDRHKTAEIGIRLQPDAQGKGVGLKAIQLMLWYLFMIRGLRKVYAQVYA